MSFRGPQVGKFEQTSSVGHQMSVAGGEVGPKSGVRKRRVLYHVIYPMMHLILPNCPPPPVNRHTPVKTLHVDWSFTS